MPRRRGLKAEATLADYNRQLATAEDRVRDMLAKAQAEGERLAATIRDKATRRPRDQDQGPGRYRGCRQGGRGPDP